MTKLRRNFTLPESLVADLAAASKKLDISMSEIVEKSVTSFVGSLPTGEEQMKSIIDGKIYDTETAQAIAESDAACSVTDFNYFCETIYRTKRGGWFLAGHGGPQTRYAKQSYGMSQGSRKIIPLSPTEAQEWLERSENFDALEMWFAVNLEEA